MGKTRNHSETPANRRSAALSFSPLRGKIKAPDHPPSRRQAPPVVAAPLDQAWERWQELSQGIYNDRHRPIEAQKASGACDGPIKPSANNYSARDINGHLYWYHQGLVFCAPAYENNFADIDNMALCGDADGAEHDLYGLDCQIAAALCRRMQDRSGAEMYQALSDHYYQQAEDKNCQYWPDIQERPTVPAVV